MLKHFFLFEIKNSLRKPMIYLFILVNFLLVFGATVSDNIVLGGSNDAVNVNAPYVIMKLTLFMTLVCLFMTTAIVNTATLRDFESKFSPLIFSTPIKKSSYLGGRYLGALLLAFLPALGVFAGIAVGAASSLTDLSETSAFSISPYLQTFCYAVVPNVLLISSVVFLLAATFKSSKVSFLGAIGLLVMYIVILSLSSDLDNERLAILADPLGINSFDILTKYNTIEEKNTALAGLSGLFLLNRVIWSLVAMACLAIAYLKFSFSEKSTKAKKVNNKFEEKSTFRHLGISDGIALPEMRINSGWKTDLAQYINQAKIEFFGVVKSVPFMVLLVIGILNMSGSLVNVNELQGTGNHPVTYLMVDAVRNSLYLFLLAIVMYYTGVLIWRERENKMNEIFDAAPYSGWIPYASKLTAIMGICVSILCTAILCGVATQAIQGYYHFELAVYIREFLVYDLAWLFAIAVLSMLLQVLVNNKYIGYFAFLLAVIVFNFGPRALEIQSNLVSYGAAPDYIYSDMNDWSLYASGLAWFRSYWIFTALVLSLVASLFWVRGNSCEFANRIKLAKQRLQGNTLILAAVLMVLWLGTGSFLWYQTKVVNEIEAVDKREAAQVAYELNYKKYAHIAQPRITDIEYKVDIFPEERDFKVQADLTLKNKTGETIKSLHLSPINDYDLKVTLPGAKLQLEDKEAGYLIYDLAKPLQAGEELNLSLEVSYISEGIENEITNPGIVKSGTFLGNFQLIPVIGYNESGELEDQKKREENNLPKKDKLKALHAGCSSACQNTYISSDSDWVNVRSTVSTSADQIAIAPGTLTEEWTEGQRKFYKYELKKPVLNFYSFVSGIYEVARKEWFSPTGKKVDLEVYYHKSHDYNVDKMLEALEHSLEYYTKHFTDYPHEQARIIEFPRYANYAQAFPGTMPYSEGIGFIANLNEEDAIDMVYYIVAHEMAHQWWAHQVIGAEVQGATMLSETFAQYSALMVMQERYGKDKMKQFLRYEADRYLRGRSREEDRELPLIFNENQEYIHYRKGSVVMYALQDYIGEDSINHALKNFALDMSYQEAPYTNTLEFMDYLRDVTPDSLQYMLSDMLEDITLYSNKAVNATYKKLAEDKYEVHLTVEIEKFRADSLGKESLIAHDDYIDIGVFSEEKNPGEKYGRPLLIERHKISVRDTSFVLYTKEKPFEAGIDPNYLLIDRFPEDNLKKLTKE